jgi:voltage-gated potassium channel
VIPITVVGKILTMIITIASIGIVAIPTGILAAGFSEAMAKEKENK